MANPSCQDGQHDTLHDTLFNYSIIAHIKHFREMSAEVVPCIYCTGPIGVTASHRCIGCKSLILLFCGFDVIVDGEVEEGYGARRDCGCRKRSLEAESSDEDVYAMHSRSKQKKKMPNLRAASRSLTSSAKNTRMPITTDSFSSSSRCSSTNSCTSTPEPFPDPTESDSRSERATPQEADYPATPSQFHSSSRTTPDIIISTSAASLTGTTRINASSAIAPESQPRSIETSTPIVLHTRIDLSEKSRIQNMIICLAGNEVTNGPVGKKESDLEPAILLRYEKWIGKIDEDFPQLRKSAIYTHEVLMMNEKKPFSGKALFRKFGEIKCEIVNHYNSIWRHKKSSFNIKYTTLFVFDSVQSILNI